MCSYARCLELNPSYANVHHNFGLRWGRRGTNKGSWVAGAPIAGWTAELRRTDIQCSRADRDAVLRANFGSIKATWRR